MNTMFSFISREDIYKELEAKFAQKPKFAGEYGDVRKEYNAQFKSHGETYQLNQNLKETFAIAPLPRSSKRCLKRKNEQLTFNVTDDVHRILKRRELWYFLRLDGDGKVIITGSGCEFSTPSHARFSIVVQKDLIPLKPCKK